MDAIFRALNDPARRALLDSLRERDGQTLTDLQGQLDMTRFGVMKHLGVLEEAGLIATRKKGRFKHHFLNALPLQEMADRWIEPFRVAPAARSLIALKAQLEGAEAMPDTLPDFILQTFIRTSSDALWDALIDPDRIAAYHFAAATARMSDDRLEMIAADGTPMLVQRTLSIDPKSRIETTFEPHWYGPDAPSSRCVYLIEEEGDVCKLTCEHYAIPEGQDGVREGWARWAAGLKTWLETGTALKETAA